MTRHDMTTVERMTPATVDVRRMDGGRRSYMDPVAVADTVEVDGLADMVRVRIYTVPSVVRDIMEGIRDTVDGATVTDGRGWWNDPVEGRMISESSATVEVVTDDPSIVADIVTVSRLAATVHNESAVMVTVEDIRSVIIWTDPVAVTVADGGDMMDPAAVADYFHGRMVTT